MLVALDKWVREGVTPPTSLYPRIDNGTLIPQQTLSFPELPGVKSPMTIKGGYRIDLNGPLNSHPLPFLVAKVDADGNERAGIRTPESSVALATYTGWNYRNAATGGTTQLVSLLGSRIPFSATPEARAMAGAPVIPGMAQPIQGGGGPAPKPPGM